MTLIDPECLQLETPTGFLIYSGPPHSDAWFANRRLGITATDVAAIVAPNEYGNALSVWLDKTGNPMPDSGSEAALWGALQEPIVADEWARRNGCARISPVGVLANVEAPWMIASLDRLVRDCPEGRGPCALEVKTRSAYVAGRWRDDIPDDVLAQVTWQMLVSGFDHVHVAVLIGGQRMQAHTVERDDVLGEFLVGEGARVWADVATGMAPDVDPDAFTVRLLNHMWPNRSGEADLDEDAARELVTGYEAARIAAAAAEDVKQVERAKVIAALGPSEVLFGGGLPAATYKADRRGVRTLRIAKRYQLEAAS